ncbi:ethanolamine ammonia-lyase subunit EutC [Gorillibacterium sp. sgz5001074]|uniref:ethanolamine ammonia-lyase subunit EutC n=1 Tax=Gorillibacterium sp. sgz5001074 TaxID=3446695 RepID=UPI003F665235
MEEPLERLKASTPARIAAGRAGTRPTTREWLVLRADHAAALDAVYGEVPAALLQEHGLFSVDSRCADKEVYLKRPDWGRQLTSEAQDRLRRHCQRRPAVQIVVSDGLSASAVCANLRDILPAFLDALELEGIPPGTPLFIPRARVGILNAVGDILEPETAVLFIGERPGLVSAESLSVYMGYRPRSGKTDADRMVLSNIRKGGTPPAEAGAYLGVLVKRMLEEKRSGVGF